MCMCVRDSNVLRSSEPCWLQVMLSCIYRSGSTPSVTVIACTSDYRLFWGRKQLDVVENLDVCPSQNTHMPCLCRTREENAVFVPTTTIPKPWCISYACIAIMRIVYCNLIIDSIWQQCSAILVDYSERSTSPCAWFFYNENCIHKLLYSSVLFNPFPWRETSVRFFIRFEVQWWTR